MKTIQKLDLAYLAGFLDADGSIIAQLKYNKNEKKLKPYQVQVTVQISQDIRRKHFMEEFCDIVGAGHVRVRPPDKRKGGPAKMCNWQITSAKDAHDFLQTIVPYLRIKKKQANLAIRIIEQIPEANKDLNKFYIVCDLVDDVANLNDSKRRTMTGTFVKDHVRRLNDPSDGAKDIIVPVETDEI